MDNQTSQTQPPAETAPTPEAQTPAPSPEPTTTAAPGASPEPATPAAEAPAQAQQEQQGKESDDAPEHLRTHSGLVSITEIGEAFETIAGLVQKNGPASVLRLQDWIKKERSIASAHGK